MTAKQILKIIITVTAVGLAAAHIIFPKINIDNVTVILIGMALVPWLEPLFKSVGLPGGISFGFQELDMLDAEAEEAGLITLNNNNNEAVTLVPKYDFIEIADKNPELAPLSLRIEIEKKLRQLATSNNIHTANLSVTGILEQLAQRNLIKLNELTVLKKMLIVLNKATHATANDGRLASWVHNHGPSIINNLEKKIIQLH
jgi:hypothetical protein